MNKNRKTIRLKEYNYSQCGEYFITICSKDRRYIFGEIKEDKIILSKYGEIAENTLSRIKQNKSIEIDNYIIMPNHIHMIIEIKYDKIVNLKDLISTYKSITTKQINKEQKIIVWQRNYYEHIIRDENEKEEIIKYIRYNPINWDRDNLKIK